MACTLQIHLDAPRFRGGDAITGVVAVEVLEDVASKGVTIDLGWRTDGPGDTDRGPVTSARVQGAAGWRAGERLRLPFRIAAPRFPVTYQGEKVSVLWILTARADVRARIDPTTERAVTLRPGAPPTGEELASLQRTSPATARRQRVGCGLRGLASLVLGLVLLGVAPVAGPFTPLAWISGTALALFGALGAAYGSWNLLAERKLGPLDLAVTGQVIAGDAVDVRLSFRPPRPLALNRITAELIGHETARRGSGKHMQLFLREVGRLPVTLHEGGRVGAGERVRFEETITVPRHAAPSFQAAQNSVRWTLALHLDIPRWPDWSLEVPIVVLPAFTPEAAGARLQIRHTRHLHLQAGQRCPYCRDGLAGTHPRHLATCGGCQAVYHEDCLGELGACATPGCARSPRSRAWT